MNGFSVHWFVQLWQGIGLIDISQGLFNSLELGVLVMVLTVVMSLMAGLAFRNRFRGSSALFYTAIGSLIMPSIVVSLGIALEFRILDDGIKALGDSFDIGWIEDNYSTALGMFTSGLGAHLSWTLPFGLLIMFAVFNRFNRAYEEAARDLGASPWQTIRYVVLPMIAPSLVGVALFGFTLSWDELARSSQAMGSANTLPIELQALTTTVTTPAIYALGTTTTAISFLVIGMALAVIFIGAAPPPAARFGCRPGHGLTMRIVIVNPNTTHAMTETIAAAAREAASSITEIVAVQPSSGPASIEGVYDGALAVPGVIEEIFRAEASGGAAAYIIACFDDTGLDAARSAAIAPVIGIGEAAFHVASLVASRFTVITTLSRSVPIIERNLAISGLAARCARVRAHGHPSARARRSGEQCSRAHFRDDRGCH